MKVLLIFPPYQDTQYLGKYKALRHVFNIIPPLGIAYIAAVLEQAKIDVTIIDCSIGISEKDLLKSVSESHPDIIGISSTTVNFYLVRQIASSLKALLPNTIFLIGGSHVTAQPEQTLENSCFDIGIIGEAEHTMLELVKHLRDKGPENLENIKGIAFKKDRDILTTGKREFIQDLDSLPMPARHLLPPLSKYHPTPASYRKLPLGHVMTSRGCPCQCVFCDRAIFGNKVRLRSPENVLDEVEELVKKYNAREIRFFDDMFTIDKDRAYKICRGLIKRNLQIPWTCLTGVNFVTKDLLKTMKQTGCWQVLYGIESADKHMLKFLRKGNTLEQNIKAVKWAKQAGLQVRADFLVGAPPDTIPSIQKTLKFAIDMKVDYAHFNAFFPYPGTALYKTLVESGHSFDFQKPCSDFNYEKAAYTPKAMSADEYKKILNHAYKKFYLRPSYILNRLLSIRTLDEFLGQCKGLLSITGAF